MIYRIKNAVIAVLILLCAQAGAASLSDIQVSNGEQQARITLSFIGEPEYAYSQDGKRTVALDIRQTGVIQGLPLQFSGNNLVKTIRAGTPKDAQSLRLLVDLTENGKTEAVKRQNGGNYTVIFTINADVPPPPPPVVAKRVESAPRPTEPARNPFKSSDDRLTGVTSSNTVTRPAARASAGAGDVLANSQSDPYLSQAVLDLQFGHSQRVGYDVATNVLSQLDGVGSLHKRRPEHASLGVLRSPDIPSILVETGFISNHGEERLLASDRYQQQIADAIYRGLRKYFAAHPIQSAPQGGPGQTASTNQPGAITAAN